MDEDHYDTPWEFLVRPQSIRLSTADVRVGGVGDRHGSPQNSPLMPHSPSVSARLVHIGNSPTHQAKRHSLRASRNPIQIDPRNEESMLLEKGVDRVEAEKRLESRKAGDFLLRARSEGSAALSLRGTNSVWHIKLERRGDKWVVGEGAVFKSISSAIHYYSRHPLPIKGAEHLLLNRSITHHASL